MELKAGTVNAIVGPSGSGKSTIAKLIASLWDVDSGSIKIGGVDVKELAFADFNRKIAYVAQDNYLFNETVRENIRQGNPDATDEQIIEVTKKRLRSYRSSSSVSLQMHLRVSRQHHVREHLRRSSLTICVHPPESIHTSTLDQTVLSEMRF